MQMLEISDDHVVLEVDEQLSIQEISIHDGSSTTEEETDVLESASDAGKFSAFFLSNPTFDLHISINRRLLLECLTFQLRTSFVERRTSTNTFHSSSIFYFIAIFNL